MMDKPPSLPVGWFLFHWRVMNILPCHGSEPPSTYCSVDAPFCNRVPAGRILSLRPLPVVRDSEIQGIPRTKRCWRSCRSSTLPRTNARCCFALSPLIRSPEQASATPANTLPQSLGSVLPVASRSQCQDAPAMKLSTAPARRPLLP